MKRTMTGGNNIRYYKELHKTPSGARRRLLDVFLKQTQVLIALLLVYRIGVVNRTRRSGGRKTNTRKRILCRLLPTTGDLEYRNLVRIVPASISDADVSAEQKRIPPALKPNSAYLLNLPNVRFHYADIVRKACTLTCMRFRKSAG